MLPSSPAEIESALLGVLLSAETTREGAAALLSAFAPALDDPSAAAIAVRDRDGLTLHVLAELGAPREWPTKLEPQFALGARPGIDPGTNVMVVPLRASGRVVGAILFGDPIQAAALLRGLEPTGLLDIAAAVLHSLATRTDAELGRRALAIRSVDTIVEGMAHQIANPLTGASAIAQLLLEDLSDEGQRASVQQIRHELTRAFAVLHDLLEFQRDTRAQDGILDLNAMTERMLRFRGYAIREQGVALDLQFDARYLPVRADARGVEHAILIALRHAEAQSHGTVNRCIAVRVVERDSEFAIEITDSGPGEIPEIAPAYFDVPLQRSEHVTRNASSDRPDLGLVDSILRGCGGRLDVSGTKTAGTTLALVLPKAFSTQFEKDGAVA